MPARPPEEKVRIVEETYLPGMSVSLVARQYGISSPMSAANKADNPRD
jgi:transposase-like protein